MQNIFGIVGWSGSGKTDLVTRLIKFFVLRSLIVSSVKHTHHEFEIDKMENTALNILMQGQVRSLYLAKKSGL